MPSSKKRLTFIQNVPTFWTYICILTGVTLWCALILLTAVWADGQGCKEQISGFGYFFFKPVCHQSAFRSFHWHGHPFAVCGRCTGIYFGFWISTLLLPWIYTPLWRAPNIKWLWIAILPSVLDFVMSVSGLITVSNEVRLLSGLILGFTGGFYILPGLFQLILNKR